MGNTSKTTLSNTLIHSRRVLLIGDRVLLLDAVRLALATGDLDVAAVGTDQQSMETSLRAFSPAVVIYEAGGIPVEKLVRTTRLLKESGAAVIGIVPEGISVDAAHMVRAGADCVLGLDTGFDDLALSVKRSLSGSAPMALDRRYVLEELLREHRKTEEHRWRVFTELSPRERTIFALVYEGLSADQIADAACVSISTVRTHVRNILTKLNVHSQLAAVAMARSNDWFSAESLVDLR
ncbi:MAG: response regulator transcription factor [Acidimicrobiia bacterium]|nr:response regulator transcription factor [Acidimicrobiia bacterium]